MLHLLDFAARHCCRDIAFQKKYPCPAMPDDTSTNLEHQVDRHERDFRSDRLDDTNSGNRRYRRKTRDYAIGKRRIEDLC